MLAMNKYPQAYIDECRERVDAQVASFRNLSAAAKKLDAKASDFDKALQAVETAYFNNLIVVLEASFVHRTRALEMKDGNPLNEVRVLANSMMSNGGVLMADSTAKLDHKKSVLGYEIGDKIRINEADFVRMAKAFFADLELKFT